MSVFKRELKFFDDAGNQEKLTVMEKWDVICDDSRNPDFEGLEEFLKIGRQYRITIEDIGSAGECDAIEKNISCQCDVCVRRSKSDNSD